MAQEYETLRWPTNLDRAAIEKRLLEVRSAAQARGLAEIVGSLESLESMSAAQIGAAVVAALTALQGKSEHRPITMQLEMVAMNLKNLK